MIFAIIAIVVVWIIGGGVAYHSTGASAAPATGTTGGRCDPCIRLRAWWASLGWAAKIGAAAWYAA